jgi:hypothetical protein
MEILIAILGAIVKGVFSVIGVSMDNKAKIEAETRKKELEGVIETTDAERRITEHVREVENAGVKPEDIFAPELPPSVDIVQ